MNHQKEVTINFPAALKSFETSKEWYYAAVNAGQDKPHSIIEISSLGSDSVIINNHFYSIPT